MESLFAMPVSPGPCAPRLTVTLAKAPTTAKLVVLLPTVVPVSGMTLATPGASPMQIGMPEIVMYCCAKCLSNLGLAFTVRLLRPMPGYEIPSLTVSMQGEAFSPVVIVLHLLLSKLVVSVTIGSLGQPRVSYGSPLRIMPLILVPPRLQVPS